MDWPAGLTMGNKRVRFADAEGDGDAELKRGLGPVQRSTLLPEPDAGVVRRHGTACSLLFVYRATGRCTSCLPSEALNSQATRCADDAEMDNEVALGSVRADASELAEVDENPGGVCSRPSRAPAICCEAALLPVAGDSASDCARCAPRPGSHPGGRGTV